MNPRTAIVIPIYNHKDAIGNTVAHLAVHGLPIFIVDDGSDAATQAVLTALARQYASQVTLLRLPVNGGKGAAVMAGLRAAYAAGYTHALQIDADGQHDAADVPRFLAAAAASPDAVILGSPVYDDSVPKARLYGRYVTHVWVWIETLSFDIRDSMCGFRIYPLALACKLIDDVALPTRMDFDIEILVRLHWRRARIVTLPTRVTYEPGGLSHFDVLWDNVRISKSHTRLVAGMLARLPVLLAGKFLPRWRHPAASGAQQGWWRMAERGSRLGMQFLALSCRVRHALHLAVAVPDRCVLPADGAHRAGGLAAVFRAAACVDAGRGPAAAGMADLVSPHDRVCAIGARQARRVVGPGQERARALR